MWASPCWPYGHMGHPLPLLRQVRTPHRAELGHWKGPVGRVRLDIVVRPKTRRGGFSTRAKRATPVWPY